VPCISHLDPQRYHILIMLSANSMTT